MRNTIKPLILAGLILAVAFSGCLGGSDDENNTSGNGSEYGSNASDNNSSAAYSSDLAALLAASEGSGGGVDLNALLAASGGDVDLNALLTIASGFDSGPDMAALLAAAQSGNESEMEALLSDDTLGLVVMGPYISTYFSSMTPAQKAEFAAQSKADGIDVTFNSNGTVTFIDQETGESRTI